MSYNALFVGQNLTRFLVQIILDFLQKKVNFMKINGSDTF